MSEVIEAFDTQRTEMVDTQIKSRGVQDPRVLEAMNKVHRESFIPTSLQRLAYRDKALRISSGQTMMPPCTVAFMLEALALKGSEKVLEVGAGAGYTAAVLGELSAEVFTLEGTGQLASKAASVLIEKGYSNVHILHSSNALDWMEQAPFEAILVSSPVESISDDLKNQLGIGGRLVAIVGSDINLLELILINRRSFDRFEVTGLADIKITPELDGSVSRQSITSRKFKSVNSNLADLIIRYSEPFESIEDVALDNLIERIGDRRIVLIGEASHGTSEFYRMRQRITQRLIEDKGFTMIAAEADWPDAAKVDHYVRQKDAASSSWQAFSRFPTWLWRNEEVREFVDWLHDYNSAKHYEKRAGFYGLDLYSLYNSASAVIDYLQNVDPDLAMIAKSRYSCLAPWISDPAAYGKATLKGSYRKCETSVVQMLMDLHNGHRENAWQNGERFLDAEQNARLVVNAERYYRVMYYGSHASWNLRDSHMFDTLQKLLNYHGENSKAIIWAHNSHIGDASATEMSARGEHNLGQLCRKAYGNETCNIGFGTDHGTVAAASSWDAKMEVKSLRPSHPESYESIFHATSLPGLILPMSAAGNPDLISELASPRLERAVGVIYRPDSELSSHYFQAELPKQFDEYIWIDKTSAITPIPSRRIQGLPDTYPFGV